MQEEIVSEQQKRAGGTMARSEKKLEGKMVKLVIRMEALIESTESIDELKGVVKEEKEETRGDVQEMIKTVVDASEQFVKLGPYAEHLFEEKILWLNKKVNWKSSKQVNNYGFICYEDMLLRYRDLKMNLAVMKKLNRMSSCMPEMEQEHRNMCQINEKLDELRYRANLLTVSNVIASRVGPGDPSAAFCSLPAILCGIIFHSDTSNHYASILLRLCKRLLAIGEALQYEKNPASEPIVTMSNILKHPATKTVVPSLYMQTIADSNGETGAVENNPQPIAQDSAHTLMISENGEIIAPSSLCLPIAKDSAMTLISKEPPKPLATNDSDGKGNCELNRK